jgi:hypothetical protein
MGILDALLTGNVGALNDSASTMEVAGRLFQAGSFFQYGTGQREAANFAATQYRQQADDAEAAGQRSAWSADQTTKYIMSKALAAAAAGGGGASDPTVVSVMSRIAGEGAYRQATALYQGADKARLLNMQAEATEYGGALAERQSVFAGLAGLAVGAGELVRGGAKARDIAVRTGNLLTSQGAGSTLLSRFGGAGGPTGYRMDATPNNFYN